MGIIDHGLNWLLDKASRRKTLDLRTATEEQMLNYALSLAQEWGPNWMKPINDRMKKIYPGMEPENIDNYSKIAGKVMSHGYAMVSRMLDEHGKNLTKDEFGPPFKSVYPWVDDRNISSLLNTGTYYHYK